jgi:aminoglycoside phosphotransferase (APT) family kinase protein
MGIPTNDDVAAAVERQLGGRVGSVTRQRRWRPTWFVEAARDGEPLNLVVRAERVDTMVFPLEHEMRFHTVLEANDIPVPKLHGWIDELGAMAMELVPGRPDFVGTADDDRDVVVDEYLGVLARLHALDIDEFVAAGVRRAASPSDSAMVGHQQLEQLFRATKRHPDPFMEFCLGWLHRHLPDSRGREAAVVWDSGQFHHLDGHLVAILDLEFGHVGDPMVDLAIWRMRDTIIPFGNFSQLYARYESMTGSPVDLEAIKRHHFAGTLSNQLMFGAAVLDPVPETDLMNNMQWNSETNLHATEALGEFLDIELPTVETPEARRTRQTNTHAHLVRAMRAVHTDDTQLQYDLRLAFRMTRHLQRVDEIGDALVEADLDDLAPVLGCRPETWWEGDEALERFVLADATTGAHDRTLVELFHRRNLRVHLQLGPAGSSMVAHFPTQRFD